MNRIIHFEIHARDPERAVKFYSNVFGWEIHEWVLPRVEMKDENRYWLVTTGPETEPGINGGIVFRQNPAVPVDGQAVNAFVCTISIANLGKSVDNVIKSGGSIIVPKMVVQGIGWWANCRDTEGNIFSMMQEDMNAR